MANPIRILATPPLGKDWSADFLALGTTVTEFGFDGVVADDSITRWDGAMITSEAFGLVFQDRANGMKQLSALYLKLADLVAAGRIGWVHICASGVDVPLFWPPMRAAHRAGIPLTHCPGVYALPIAQYVLAHILSITRMLPQHAAQQSHNVYAGIVQRDARNCAVGIVGAGGIGSELARMAKAVGMKTYGLRRNAQSTPDFDEMLTGPEGLEKLLIICDFVVLTLPLTPTTKHMLGERELALMKPTSWLINIARGGIVDELALIRALKADGCAPAGAVLDVFAQEPLSADSELWDLPNVVITPHDSWRTDEALKDNHRYFIDNVARFARGQPLKGHVTAELMAPILA